MKPTDSSIQNERLDWSLSWHPDGHCDSFTREAILLFAPRISGVYGLFNQDCQVFIGESGNICEALLRHESETDFRSQHLRPTGFTFEPCAAEFRKSKADDLIARFHPVLQTQAALNESPAPLNSPLASGETPQSNELKSYPDRHEFPVHEHERNSKNRWHFHLKPARLAALFIASALLAVYLGMPADYAIQKRANGANTTTALGPQSASERPAVQSAGTASAKPEIRVSASAENASVHVATKRLSAANRAAVLATTAATAQSAQSAEPNKTWSVQVSSTPSKDTADKLAQRLKSEGYAVYVVRAEVKGQTYHRVRVGPFSAREEAEPVRQSLTRREDYRDAYLAAD